MHPAIVPVEALNESERNVAPFADEWLLARVLGHVSLEQTGPLERFLAVGTADGFFQSSSFRAIGVVHQPMGSLHVGFEIFLAGEKFFALDTVVVEIGQNGCAG